MVFLAKLFNILGLNPTSLSVFLSVLRSSMISATEWYRTLSTFSQTMPILNNLICLKCLSCWMLFYTPVDQDFLPRLKDNSALFCYALLLNVTKNHIYL